LAKKLGYTYEETSSNDLNSLNWVFKQIAKRKKYIIQEISLNKENISNNNFSPDKNFPASVPLNNNDSPGHKGCC